MLLSRLAAAQVVVVRGRVMLAADHQPMGGRPAKPYLELHLSVESSESINTR